MTVTKLVKLIRNDEGSGLVLALMTLMVFSILGVALGTITIGSYKLGDVNRDDNSAYYIAEAGANLAYEEIETIINNTYKENSNETSFYNSAEYQIFNSESTNKVEGKMYSDGIFEKQFGEQPEATITVEQIGEDTTRDYSIKSVGNIGNRERIVEKKVTVTWIDKGSTGPGYGALPSSTTIANKQITINNNVEFLGGTVYLNSSDGILDVTQNFDNEGSGVLKVVVPPGASESIIKTNNNDNIIVEESEQNFDWTIYEKELNKFPAFPTNPEYTSLPSASGKDDIVIETNDNDISILVDDLYLTNNLVINGSGRVDIYVKGTLDINGNVEVNNDGKKTNQLQIFHDAEKGEVINFGNGSVFNGTLFSNLANLEIKNNVKFTGLFITGGDVVNMGSGDFNSLLIAPDAVITLSNSNTDNAITGITVGREIILPQNANLKFSDYYLKEYPLQVPDIENDGGGTGGGTGEEDTGSGSGDGSEGGDLIISEPGVEN